MALVLVCHPGKRRKLPRELIEMDRLAFRFAFVMLTVAGAVSCGSAKSELDGGIEADGGTSQVHPPMSMLGTLVVMGDSISDNGGVAPFYYDKLKSALELKFPGTSYFHVAKSGSKADDLIRQINTLPVTLPGPVAVVMTSGGNDMRAALLKIVLGTDAPARATMRMNLQEALTELLSANRFGPDVLVRVYEANIYDSSDGVGDFVNQGCLVPYPESDTSQHFERWNGEIAAEVAEHGQQLIDLHALFAGHGISSASRWYAADCIHPNALGHDALYRSLYQSMTGLEAP